MDDYIISTLEVRDSGERGKIKHKSIAHKKIFLFIPYCLENLCNCKNMMKMKKRRPYHLNPLLCLLQHELRLGLLHDGSSVDSEKNTQ